MNILAVVPIRSGSKGIPDKNIYPIQGKPLVFYVISALLASTVSCDICVSSDSDEYLETCSSVYSSIFPVKRSYDLASDETPDVPVLKHCLQSMQSAHNRKDYTHILLVHATSPLVEPDDFTNAITQFVEDPVADSLVSVCELDIPLRKLKQLSNGYLLDLPGNPVEKSTSRRQDSDSLFARNGAFYLMTIDQLNSGNMWGNHVMPYIMPKARSIDINDYDDLTIAEALISLRSRTLK